MTSERELVAFPNPQPERRITLSRGADGLLNAPSPALLIHGGPGAGKTFALDALKELVEFEDRGVALGPFDVAVYRDQTHPETVFCELALKILEQAGDRFSITSEHGLDGQAASSEHSLRAIGDLLKQMSKLRRLPAVLLIDNFDQIHPWAHLGVATLLRALFVDNTELFTFVLTLESDLEELNQEHIYSPMKGISESYLLEDLPLEEARELAKSIAAERELELRQEEFSELWTHCRGYPALIQALFDTLARGRKRRRGYSVSDARSELLGSYRRLEPMHTTVARIEELCNLGPDSQNPAYVLRRMVEGQGPRIEDLGARTLLAMGILDWKQGGKVLTWRNDFIRAFWHRLEEERHLLTGWMERVRSFQRGHLNAEGEVLVSLLMDLGPLLTVQERSEFNKRRGTDPWARDLLKLPDELGPFVRWTEQRRLTRLGNDLDLYRQRVVEHSFMPIYEVSTKDLDLDFERLLRRFSEGVRLADENRLKAQEILEREYRRWDRVRIQLTRDGAIHLTLVRELVHPLPLMQILTELLGLESEIEGAETLRLSVEWELALAIADAFIGQEVGRTLDLRWQGGSGGGSEPRYPLRDRYVIYLVRKLCKCSFGDLARSRYWPLVKVGDLELRAEQRGEDERVRQAGELASLLEGVMIREQLTDGVEVGKFPRLKGQDVGQLLSGDLSSWQNELFVASLDNALLVYQATEKHRTPGHAADEVCRACRMPEKRRIRDLYFPNGTVSYEDYWQCLALGLQYLIELRWSAQWIANQTTIDLKALANLMEKRVDQRQPKNVAGLGQSLALTTRLLSHLRDASIPLSIAGSGYAARKYERLIEVSGLRETIRSAEKNIEGINDFLKHHEGQRLQRRAQKLTNVVSLGGGVLAFLAILLTLPSMWIDFAGGSDKGDLWGFFQSLGIPIDWLLGVQIFLSLVVVMLAVFVGWRMKWMIEVESDDDSS